MPYIKSKKSRGLIEENLNRASMFIMNCGDLNFAFTILCKRFIEIFGESYTNYATCVSSLVCAKLELYRRKIAPYEDKKIEENGDVW